jgi:aminoglycoside phosphotransferase (APT) family kinase protein
MTVAADLSALHRALLELPAFARVGSDDLVPMAVKGLAHDHVAIRGSGALLRVPKQSQFALSAADNLAYQAACFERVSVSGHGPRLHGVIEPRPSVPMGALVVDHIHGRPPRLPEDLQAFAEAMAKVHSLPLPAPAARPPLADHQDPVGGALKEIEAQASFLDAAGLSPGARTQIDDELAWARTFGRTTEAGPAQPVTLVLTDTHPGNFLIQADGRAVIVDLEKALYGSPGTDLAHATVYSSTTWDLDCHAVLRVEEVARFYRCYLEIAQRDLARRLRPWLLPMRRLLFLRAITWCAMWRVKQAGARLEAKHAAESTEDWSAEASDPALIAHVAGRVDDYLSEATLKHMRAEWLRSPSLDDLF